MVETKKLSNEELERINAGNGGDVDGWFWDSVYKVVSWTNESDVQFIFNYGDKLKIITVFGSGDEGQVVNRKTEYSSSDGGWIDKYLVDIGESTNYWCKRDVIVYQG